MPSTDVQAAMMQACAPEEMVPQDSYGRPQRSARRQLQMSHVCAQHLPLPAPCAAEASASGLVSSLAVWSPDWFRLQFVQHVACEAPQPSRQVQVRMRVWLRSDFVEMSTVIPDVHDPMRTHT